ncbi:hypothetical protein TKK_0019245 [Trichogramma kaykai]|uniref:Peptidase M14 domain-containing protein n=1 Tax=Trichogramma kaykai TaxID=54128 RepID=A0ABD2VTL7_9HYME
MSFQPERGVLEHTSLYQRAESEDSDAEGGLGNVNKLVIRPPGHSGKAKKGHLCFDASFETGNLGRVDLVSEFEYDLFIRPDTCSPRLRLWFNFTVDNVRQDQRVIFNIVNISKSKNLFRQGMTPLVRSSNRHRWQRLPLKQVFYYKSTEHQDHYILSFAFAFDREDEFYQFALTYPYSYSRHLGYLNNLISKFPVVKRDTIASSIQKRDVELISLTSEQNYQPLEPEQKMRRCIVLIARIHPGESPSSFVCQGFVDFVVSAHPIAKILRDYFMFKIVPMINPDGVYVGNYRSNCLGMDLNRSWSRISPWIHPTLLATKNLLETLDKDVTFPLDCVLDLHAHTNATGIFVYGNTYEDVYRYERHIVLPKLLSQMAEDYDSDNTMYNADSNKEGTARRYLCSILSEHVNCYTLHVSMHGYKHKNTGTILPYTEESYYRVGRNLARAFFEYYRVTGLIPTGLPDQPKHKRSRQSRQKQRVQREPRPRTARTPAPLHFATIHEYFEAENQNKDTELLLSGSRPITNSFNILQQQKQNYVSKKHFLFSNNLLKNQKNEIILPPSTKTEPSLTIIDFNQLTRGGLELAKTAKKVTLL